MGPYIILEKHVSPIVSHELLLSTKSPCHICHFCELGRREGNETTKEKKNYNFTYCTKFPTNQHLIVFSFTLVEDTYKK